MRILELLWLATATSFAPLMAASVTATLLGLAVALSEEHRLLWRGPARVFSICLLLFLFYPRSIVQSTILSFLTIAVDSSFSQSVWGLAVANFPAQLATCYLIFAITIQVQSYTKTAARYLRNADGQPMLKALLVSAHPFQLWIAASIGIAYCSTGFQAAMSGSTGFITTGAFVASSLKSPDLPASDRLELIVMAVVWLAGSLAAVVGISFVALGIGIRFARQMGRTPAMRRLLSHRDVVGWMLRGASALVAALVVLLHLIVQLRLWGLAPSAVELLGMRIGLESTLPGRPDFSRFAELADAGIAGSAVGALVALVIWFSRLRAGRETLTRRREMILAISLAAVAFLPSSFPGAIGLSMADTQNTRWMLAAWSAVAAGAFTSLLVSQDPAADRHYRYDNVGRLVGRTRAAVLFLREYAWLLASLAVLALFANFIDDGFRTQVDAQSIGRSFRNLNGQWAPEQRGLALLMLLAAIVVTSFLKRRSTSVNYGRDLTP